MPNMHLIRQVVDKQLLAGPVNLIVLPEVFNGVLCHDDAPAGPVARRFLSTLARTSKAAVVGGVDYACEDGCRRNACFVVGADGEQLGVYYKRVMFGRERGTRTAGMSYGVFEIALEHRETASGDAPARSANEENPVRTRSASEGKPRPAKASQSSIRVGVLICGDMWDARLAAELRDRVDVLCVPVKTRVPEAGHIDYARRLWWNLALTRAMENAIPIVVSDWAEGRHEAYALVEGTRVQSVHYTTGGSSISDPGRRPHFEELQQTIPRGQPGILAADIDLDAVARFREYRKAVGLLPDN